MIVAEKLEDASFPTPSVGGAVHAETPNWRFRTGSLLTLASIFPKTNELRLTSGLAIDIPYTLELSRFVNYLNEKKLVFGRMFTVPNNDPEHAAVLMQEIVYGDGLSWDYPPSIQNLLRIMATLSGQGDHLISEIVSRFDARPFSDAEVGVLLVNC
jgi:hypothetical protein